MTPLARDDAVKRLCEARLYFLLTRELCRHDPIEVLRAALRGGVDLVQIREKHMDDVVLTEWVKTAHSMTQPLGVPLIVNDRTAVALAAGAEGVHLGQSDQTVGAARSMPGGQRLLVGLSTHSAEDVARLPQGTDSIGIGPVFDTATKGVRGCGLALLQAGADCRVPWFAIGGINSETLPLVVTAGARRVAVSSALCGAADPEALARMLRGVLH